MSLKDQIRETKGNIRKHRLELMAKVQNAPAEKRQALKDCVAKQLGSKPLQADSNHADDVAPGPPGPLVSGDKASTSTHGPGAEETMPRKGEENEK
jgi:hypothetical protein